MNNQEVTTMEQQQKQPTKELAKQVVDSLVLDNKEAAKKALQMLVKTKS